MSFALSSFRSQIFKHLGCTNTTFFFSISHIHHLTSHSTFPFLPPSSASALQEQRVKFYIRSLNPVTAKSSSNEETSNAVSSSSAYLSVNIRCSRDVADMLSEALLCFGASSAGTDEPDSFRSDDEICITSIFSVTEDVHTGISSAANSIGLREIPSYEVKIGYESDWIKETQESFHPVEVTEGLWIVPEWKTPPDFQATNIILNPGLAFGTGDHPTTKLCLLLLHRLIKGGELFLDYGTGSGILAIAALKLGASLSVGVDIDPQAITSARHNASLNNINPEMLQFHLVGNKSNPSLLEESTTECVEEQNLHDIRFITESEKYDVVIANILMNPLLDLADKIVSFCKPGAVVGLSGIISEQLPCIMERYSPFLEDITVSKIDDWVCVSGTKKTDLGDS